VTEQLTTFVEMVAHLDLDAYTFLPEPHLQTFHKLKRLRVYANVGDNQALIQELKAQEQPDELVRVYAASMIVCDRVDVEQLKVLGQLLLADRNLSVRIALAKKFKDIPLDIKELASWLLRAVIYDRDIELRVIAAEAARNMNMASEEIWQEKVGILLKLVEESGYYREHLDIAALATAVVPPYLSVPTPNERFRLTDCLISLAVGHSYNPRMIGIIAAIIIQSCGHNIQSVLQRLKKFTTEHKDSEKELITLQTEINSLLTPAELQISLKETYQQPLQNMRKDVHSKWKIAVLSAQFGLVLRFGIVLSITIIGILLLGKGAYHLSDPTTWSVSFLQIGLGLVLTLIVLIFRGTLRDAQQTLVNVGVANMVYATFVQQSLDMSLRYATLSLQNQLTAMEMEASNKLLTEALQNSVQVLRSEKLPTLDEFIKQYT
jgi:hypothetical protein